MPSQIRLWNTLDYDRHRRRVESNHSDLLKLRDKLCALLYPKQHDSPNEALERERNHVRLLTDQFVDAVLRPTTFFEYVTPVPIALA